MANRDELLVLAAQIVSAHVANNTVVPGDVPKLIDAVYHALSKVGRSPDTAPPADPAVSVKRSVTADHLVCLECGKHFSMLKRHLGTDHQLTPGQYRQKWGSRRTIPSSRRTMPGCGQAWPRNSVSEGPKGGRDSGGELA